MGRRRRRRGRGGEGGRGERRTFAKGQRLPPSDALCACLARQFASLQSFEQQRQRTQAFNVMLRESLKQQQPAVAAGAAKIKTGVPATLQKKVQKTKTFKKMQKLQPRKLKTE
jgi:hypothetical protein